MSLGKIQIRHHFESVTFCLSSIHNPPPWGQPHIHLVLPICRCVSIHWTSVFCIEYGSKILLGFKNTRLVDKSKRVKSTTVQVFSITLVKNYMRARVKTSIVEMRGIEPLASWMWIKRSATELHPHGSGSWCYFKQNHKEEWVQGWPNVLRREI